MNKSTEMTVTVRELSTDWQPMSVGRVVKEKRSWILLDLKGKQIAKSTSLEKVAAAGRRWAFENGFVHGCGYGVAEV